MTTAAAPVERRAELSLRGHLGRALSVVVPVLIWFAPLDIEATTKHGLAITSFMILAWITEALDHSVAGLISHLLALQTTRHGFSSAPHCLARWPQSPAWPAEWLSR